MSRFQQPGSIASGGVTKKATRATATVTLDTLDGPRLDVDERGNLRLVRTALVTGLLGPGASVLLQAVTAKGMPLYGSGHPEISGILVTNLSASLIDGSTGQAKVEITYGPPNVVGTTDFHNEPDDEALPTLEVVTTVQGVTTMLDVNGDALRVKYTKVTKNDAGQVTSTEEIEQGGEVEYMLPMETVIFRRREIRNPHAKARQYVGTVNSSSVFGDGPRMWMCTRLSGVSDDGGQSYNVTYEFQRNPNDWDVTYSYIDPATGKPPPDAKESPGAIKTSPIYREANFELLNLVL